jgi:Protein of unknown function (DUF3106)
MMRTMALVALLALAAAGEAYSDQNKAPAKPAPAPKGGVPKAGVPRMGPPITNPGSLAARLYRLNPSEREQALEKFPPERQEQVRKNLKWFDGLPKEQQQMVLKWEERFAALPPPERRAIQQQIQALNHLPKERHLMVGQALRRMQGMTDEQRLEFISRPSFRERFSPEELQIIEKLSEVLPPV